MESSDDASEETSLSTFFTFPTTTKVCAEMTWSFSFRAPVLVGPFFPPFLFFFSPFPTSFSSSSSTSSSSSSSTSSSSSLKAGPSPFGNAEGDMRGA